MIKDEKVLHLHHFENYVESVFEESGASGVLCIPRYLAEDSYFGDEVAMKNIIDHSPISSQTEVLMRKALLGHGHLPFGFTLKQRGEALNGFKMHSRWYEEASVVYFFYVRFIGEYVGIDPDRYVDHSQHDGIDWASYGAAIKERLQEI